MFNQNIKFVKNKIKTHFFPKKTSKQIKTKTKSKNIFSQNPSNKRKTREPSQNIISSKKTCEFRTNLGGQTFSWNFWKCWPNDIFFGKAHEVRSTRTLVVQTCTENVRLPISMQALIWFPEVLRITLTFERLWESRQKRLKNDLTVDNYWRKKKEMRGGVEGHLIF